MSSNQQSDTEYTLAPPEHLFPLTRHFSYRITPILLKYPITPNQVTVASLVTGLSGGVCFLAGQWGWNIIGALLLVISFTLDNCDGELARLKNMFSSLGAKLDDISDSLVDGTFFVMLGFGTSFATGEQLWMWLGLVTAAGATIDYSICLYREIHTDPASNLRDEQARNPKRPQDAIDWTIYIFHQMSRAEFCNIVLILALFNLTWILLPLGAVGAQVYWIVALFPKSRGWHV